MPFFPNVVNNVTVTVGQNAELKCQVDNLKNFKVNNIKLHKLHKQRERASDALLGSIRDKQGKALIIGVAGFGARENAFF